MKLILISILINSCAFGNFSVNDNENKEIEEGYAAPGSLIIDRSISPVSGSNTAFHFSLNSEFNNLSSICVSSDSEQFVSGLSCSESTADGQITINRIGETEVSFLVSENMESSSVKYYFYSDGNKTSCSAESVEDAKTHYFYDYYLTYGEEFRLFVEDPVNNPLVHYNLSHAEAENILFNFIYSDDATCSYSVSNFMFSNYLIVSGDIKWQDPSGTLQPLRRTIVEIRNANLVEDYDVITTAKTDEFGHFVCSINSFDYSYSNFPLMVSVYSITDAANVGNYFYNSAIIENITFGKQIIFDIDFFPDESVRMAAMEVAQAELIPYDYVKQMRYELALDSSNASDISIDDYAIPQARILYPSSGFGGSSYVGLFNTIHLSKRTYNNWDTLHHEYGHYIEKELKLCRKCPLSQHSFSDWLPNTLITAARGYKVAFSEGLATYLALACQNFYHSMFSFNYYGDNKFETYEIGLYQMGNTPIVPGFGSEASVACVLYKMLDADHVFTNLNLSHKQMWNILETCHNEKTFYNFVNQVFLNFPSYEENIKLLLLLEGFNPIVPIQTPSYNLFVTSGDFVFEWSKNTGYNFSYYVIKFEDESGNILSSYESSTGSFSLSRYSANTLLGSITTSSIYWTLLCYESNGHFYNYGEKICFFENEANELSPDLSTVEIEDSGYALYYVNSPIPGDYIFESFSENLDTYCCIYNSLPFVTSNLISYDDDGGSDYNFSLEYQAQSNTSFYVVFFTYDHETNISFNVEITFPHIHSYSSSYLIYNSTYHKVFCSCGSYELRPHTVNQSQITTIHGQSTAPCIFCHAIVNLSDGHVIVGLLSNGTYYVTDNGSYILESGIIVVVPEDIESYINGILEFHLNSLEIV